MEFDGEYGALDTPARVTVASDRANRSYPVFITAKQEKGVFAWQLPLVVEAGGDMHEFSNVSRTLCPHNNLFARDEHSCELSSGSAATVHVSSSSPTPVSVAVRLETVADFYVRLDTPLNVTVTPSQPQYYFYPFDQGPDARLDLDVEAANKRMFCSGSPPRAPLPAPPRAGWPERSRSVIVTIDSDDDICAVVSIQNYSCPVFDNERDILYDGYYLTMTRRGGITLTQETFPLGFYVVFIAKSSDEACTGNSTEPLAPAAPRLKTFRLKVIETISYVEYARGAGAALGFFLAFYVVWFAGVLLQRRCRSTREDGGSTVLVEDGRTPPSARRRRVVNDGSSSTRAPSSCSDTESEAGGGAGAGAGSGVGMGGGALRLASLARSRTRVLAARSRLYLWTVLTVAVFYTLPVAQLVLTYQRLLDRSGDQDLCYFNFLCAHPLGPLTDFNHVFSNVGYVLLGALFLLQVRRRGAGRPGRGIPQHRGLLYAMGAALAAEGLLSAAYHVCPNSMNFQFDTSFMYVTAALGMVRLYQARHPDINARAHATFAVLALVIALGVAGVLTATPLFWALFTALHLLTCLVLTFQIYYLGRFRLEKQLVWRVWGAVRRGGLAAAAPTHCGRCVMLLLANIANWAIAAYGLTSDGRDFASHLLLVMLGNLFLYTLFYIAMKLLTGERPRAHSWAWVAAAHAAWAAAAYFYLDLNTNWALTPAESRRENRACSLLRLYDAHDAWHFLSATAMFCSFNMYLTLDDNLADVPRDAIAVF
ncbi:SID1 transmembrane family member 1-like isoform X2 [Aricia agestis]|nr:SID1 transmembrane family member 1-like isoform X2 [Aricia agestis]